MTRMLLYLFSATIFFHLGVITSTNHNISHESLSIPFYATQPYPASSVGSSSSLNSEVNKTESVNVPKNDPSSLVKVAKTFSGFRNFASQGPRPNRIKAGKSKIELLNQTLTNFAPRDNKQILFKSKVPYYAAAWLCSMQSFRKRPRLARLAKEQPNWNPVLESGTWNGVLGRDNYLTYDMMDFFVHHLSRYKHGGSKVWKNNWQSYLHGMDQQQETYEQEIPFNNPTNKKNGNVLVLAPFHAAQDNHSKESEKQLHLNLTVKALARVFPNIVISVCDQENYDFVMNESGLNEYIYDILLVKNLKMEPLNRCTHLPALTPLHAREKIIDGTWPGFEWVYYTETDQPPHLRNPDDLLRQTLLSDKAVVVPHRSFPVPVPQDLNDTVNIPRGIKGFLSESGIKMIHNVPDLMSTGCCYDTNKTTVVPFSDSRVQVFRQHNSHPQVAGGCNPIQFTCSTCTLIDKRNGGFCHPNI